jgi:hypothetical protein
LEQKPKHHQVPVIRIKEILPHLNADTLSIIPIEGFQVVVKKDEYKVSDLAYYIYPDSIVPIRPEFEFLWKDRVLPGEEPPIKYRRISVRRFRKEWSEGLLMHITKELQEEFGKVWDMGISEEIDDLSDFLGITHYQPPEPEDMYGQNERGPKSPYPRSFKGWLYWVWYQILNKLGFDTPLRGVNEKGPKNDKPYYDIENYKNHIAAFEPNEMVWVSEKIHGCQGKFVYQDKHMYAGSRRMWKSTKSNCIWRKCLAQNSWIEEWCRANEGYTLYGEVFPCQGDNFMYGCKPGEIKFKVFDILNPKYEWLPWDYLKYAQIFQGHTFPSTEHWVPTLYEGIFNEVKIKELATGKSTLDSKTIREGVVVKPLTERHVRGLGRLVLKIISNQYLEKS